MCMYIDLNECILKYILLHTVRCCDMTCVLFGVLFKCLDDVYEIKKIGIAEKFPILTTVVSHMPQQVIFYFHEGSSRLYFLFGTLLCLL
jgi:hypothetical protein